MNATITAPLANGQRFFGRTYTPKAKYSELPGVLDVWGTLEKTTHVKPQCAKEDMTLWYKETRDIVDLYYSQHGAFRTEQIRAICAIDPYNPNHSWGAFALKIKSWGYKVVGYEKTKNKDGNGRLACVWGK